MNEQRALYIDKDLVRRMKVVASINGKTIREVTEEAISEWLTSNEKKAVSGYVDLDDE